MERHKNVDILLFQSVGYSTQMTYTIDLFADEKYYGLQQTAPCLKGNSLIVISGICGLLPSPVTFAMFHN